MRGGRGLRLGKFSFLVDESAVLQAGAPFVSSVSPASGASGVGSSVRLSGGNFASSPSASFRVVVADAASRVRLAGSMAAACSPPADSFIDCGVPSHPRGSVVLVLEYSVSGSSAGPWERAQAYFASTGAFRITGRTGFATGIKLLQAPASLVRGELLQPAPRAVLVDDFGQAVESDSSTIVRIAAFSGERGSEVATLQPVAGPPASGSAMPSLSVAARSGVVQFDGLGVAATSLAVGRQLRLVLSAETGDERSVLGTSTDFVRGYAGTAGLGGRSSLSGCGVVDARGLCCEPPLWLDSCGICSSAAAASARSCGIRIELPVRVRATGTGAAGLPSESVLAQLRAGVGAVAGFAEAATARAVVMPPLSSGGAALVGSSGASGFSADGPFVTGARMVASAVVPPPSGGWPPSGPGSRTSVEARLRSATQDSADPLLGAASGPVSSQGGALEMDSARGSVVLEGTIVCAAPCPPPGDWAAGSDCPLCAPDPEGVTSNASLLQAAWVEAVEPEAMESGKGVCNASADAAALPVAVFGDESATESALAAAHTVVLLSTVGLALLQGVIDSSRAVWGAPPLHSGPGSAIASALPSLAVVGMGVLDVADHGQFAVMLSQLHLTAPPVLRRSGELLVSSTGLIPGVWGVLRPSPPSDMVWGPPNASSYSNASVAQSESGLPGGGEASWWLAFPEDPVGDSSVPSSVRALASPLGARPEDLLELGAVSLAAAEAAFALAFGFLIVTSCFLTRPDSRAGSGAGKPIPSSEFSVVTPLRAGSVKAKAGGKRGSLVPTKPGGAEEPKPAEPRSTASRRPRIHGPTALANRLAVAMAAVASIYFSSLTLAGMFEVSRVPGGPNDAADHRLAGWLLLFGFSLGFAALQAHSVLRQRPFAWLAPLCGCCQQLGSAPGGGPVHVGSPPYLVHAHQGRGARVFDATGRSDHERAAGRWWLLAALGDRFATSMLLVALDSRPGAQVGAMLAKQVLVLTLLLATTPPSSGAAHAVKTVVVVGRAVVLAMALAFVPPYGLPDLEAMRLVGILMVAVQLALALLVFALVAVRFPLLARFAAATLPCASAKRKHAHDVVSGAASGGARSLALPGGRHAARAHSNQLTLLAEEAGSGVGTTARNPMWTQKAGFRALGRSAQGVEAESKASCTDGRAAEAPAAAKPGPQELAMLEGMARASNASAAKLLAKGAADAARRARGQAHRRSTPTRAAPPSSNAKDGGKD
ncbi:hypothetical protein FNF29_03273 [Cafeteria roenbergensis]|uniref:TRP C-terminal domain-containing protein n=1 Tax=Cafeteria roenbergensis TaxID=33653 RepID=A0A5A8CK74_CAFRO|nr:hypothetical protein FNF29_03273 [Cafeteria roenbergensis]|eukprot:KAA0153456.1 hypothetical protein FNF29_03273 [Cafeteria roenbergensis]